jgi:hypothetical protein
LEKTADTDFLREMLVFSAQGLMELEIETLTGAAHGSRNADRPTHVTATVGASGKPAAARSNCVYPSSARAAISRASWSRGG